jgi:hypothetical protein
LLDALAVTHEERIDEIGGGQRGFANEVADRGSAAESAGAGYGKHGSVLVIVVGMEEVRGTTEATEFRTASLRGVVLAEALVAHPARPQDRVVLADLALITLLFHPSPELAPPVRSR